MSLEQLVAPILLSKKVILWEALLHIVAGEEMLVDFPTIEPLSCIPNSVCILDLALKLWLSNTHDTIRI